MADVQRLSRKGQIRRPKKKAKLMNDKQIRIAVPKYSSGSCTITVSLYSVSQRCDNVTHPLNQDDDSESSTAEYEWDDVDDSIQTDQSLLAAIPQL